MFWYQKTIETTSLIVEVVQGYEASDVNLLDTRKIHITSDLSYVQTSKTWYISNNCNNYQVQAHIQARSAQVIGISRTVNRREEISFHI